MESKRLNLLVAGAALAQSLQAEGHEVSAPKFDGTMTDEQIRAAQNLAADGSRIPEFTRPALEAAAAAVREDARVNRYAVANNDLEYVLSFVEAFFRYGQPTKYHVPEALRRGQPLPGETLASPGKVKGWNACRQAIIKAARSAK